MQYYWYNNVIKTTHLNHDWECYFTTIIYGDFPHWMVHLRGAENRASNLGSSELLGGTMGVKMGGEAVGERMGKP